MLRPKLAMPVRRVHRDVRAPAELRRRYAANHVTRELIGTAAHVQHVPPATIVPDFQMFKARQPARVEQHVRPELIVARRAVKWLVTVRPALAVRNIKTQRDKPAVKTLIQDIINQAILHKHNARQIIVVGPAQVHKVAVKHHARPGHMSRRQTPHVRRLEPDITRRRIQ